jgi:formylmethanofuran dehydrogenase subunit C
MSMTLRLTYKATATVPVEVEGVLPETICGRSLDDVARLPVFHGNRRVPLGELFDVAGDTDQPCVEFAGDLLGVHWIGAGMTGGTLRIAGSAGRHVGSDMQGGRIEVRGDVGDDLGTALQGGEILVLGGAGDRVGAAHRGASRGMTGGTIAVTGNAGHEVGAGMRRGVIAVGGRAGDWLGANLLAGTILAAGGAGRQAGANMRRGTILLGGSQPPELLPTFRYACRYGPTFLPLLTVDLQRCGLPLDPAVSRSEYDAFSGDHLELGRGEILVRVC